MGRPVSNPKRLLVEGADEQRVIPELIEANGIPWGERRIDWIVEIVDANGKTSLLDPLFLSAHFDDAAMCRIGLILDADHNAGTTYDAARKKCLDHFPTLPASLPPEGAIAEHDGRTLGVWVMPDNQSRGMLETFLAFLVDDTDPLWPHAQAARAQAVGLGAPVKPTHHDKADIHTWLAWRDPPGRQLHDAVKQRILRPDSPYAAPFVQWFRQTFAV